MNKKAPHHEDGRRSIRVHHLLLFPRPAPAPALRLRSRLGAARLGRRLFGPTVTHAWVCPPAPESMGIKSNEELPEELEGQGGEGGAGCQRRGTVKEKKTLVLSVIVLGRKIHFIRAQLAD